MTRARRQGELAPDPVNAREGLAAWLEIDPSALAGVPEPAIDTLAALVETAMTQYPEMLAALRDRADREERSARELALLALTDHLTGVANRRGLELHLADELVRARRYDRPISVISIDLDRLKQVNDELGHPAGDEVIRVAAQCLSRHVRASDFVGRLGGDEFVIVCPETDAADAAGLMAKLRTVLAENPLRLGATEVGVSCSMGSATAGQEDTLATLLEAADAALYSFKRGVRARPKTS